MALQGAPEFGDAVVEMMVQDIYEAELHNLKVVRALHQCETPYAVLKGGKKALKLARKLGVRAEIKWVRDPDWEPLRVEWREDDTLPRS